MNSFVKNIYGWMYSLCCTSRDSTTEEGRDKKLQFVCFIDDWGCLLRFLVKGCEWMVIDMAMLVLYNMVGIRMRNG